jgi:hypothetical protein
MKFRVVWDVATCSHVEVDRRFRCAPTSQKTLNLIQTLLQHDLKTHFRTDVSNFPGNFYS